MPLQEEYRSESDEDRDKHDKVVTITVDTGSGEPQLVHLLVSRTGVQKVSQQVLDGHLATVGRTIVPIKFDKQPSKFQEKKAGIENINSSVSSGADLAGVVSQDVEQTPLTTNNKQTRPAKK